MADPLQRPVDPAVSLIFREANAVRGGRTYDGDLGRDPDQLRRAIDAIAAAMAVCRSRRGLTLKQGGCRPPGRIRQARTRPARTGADGALREWRAPTAWRHRCEMRTDFNPLRVSCDRAGGDVGSSKDPLSRGPRTTFFGAGHSNVRRQLGRGRRGRTSRGAPRT
jgi:hypothetical protein